MKLKSGMQREHDFVAGSLDRKLTPDDSMPMTNNQHPFVYAVVLNYNGTEDTRECVSSLQQSGYPRLEIVIVDNASPDGSAEVITRSFPDLPLLRQATNGGYAAGNNAGIRYVLARNADFILVINNDVVVEKGFLEPMVNMLRRDSGIGVVNAKVFYQSAPQEIFSAVGEFSRWLCTGLNKGRDAEACRSTTLECDVDYVCGVLLLIRREVFETIGLLDERFFMYFEDVEFSQRVRTQYRLAYTARSVAFHKSGGGKGWRAYTELYLYYHTRNRLWVFRNETWPYRVYVALFTLATALAKAAIIFLNCVDNPRKMLKQWEALYDGIIDGLIGHSR